MSQPIDSSSLHTEGEPQHEFRTRLIVFVLCLALGVVGVLTHVV